MKYIIMAGGNYHTDKPKQLREIQGEPIIARTIRLLRNNGVEDIAISSNDPRFDSFGVPVLHHKNTFGDGGHWIEAFYPMDDPVCYMFGDVVFSDYAIKTIVEYQTDSIMFFASSPPFDRFYTKEWAEPFAFKVVDTKLFKESIGLTIYAAESGKFKREPIAWELWQVIKHTPLNTINYKNYRAINDFTCDCDNEEEYKRINEIINNYPLL